MKARTHILPRRPLCAARPFGVLATPGRKAAPTGTFARSPAEMQFFVPSAVAEGSTRVSLKAVNKITLNPYFSLLVNWVDRSAKRFEEISKVELGQVWQVSEITKRNILRHQTQVTHAAEARPVRSRSLFHRSTNRDRGAGEGLHTISSGIDPTTSVGSHAVTTRLLDHFVSVHRSDRPNIMAVRRLFSTTDRRFLTNRATHMRTTTAHERNSRDSVTLLKTVVAERSLRASAAGSEARSPSRIANARTGHSEARAPSLRHRANDPNDVRETRNPQAPRQAAPVTHHVSERAFRAPEPPVVAAPLAAPERVARHAVPEPTIDLNRLETDLWQRFERRVRIEQERRGRH